MMKKKLLVLLLLISVLFWATWLVAQKAVSEQESNLKKATEEKTVTPSPKSIKEKTAIFVFIGWMWLSIVVLIFILRAKIREVDRLNLIKFFPDQKRSQSQNSNV